VIGGKHRAERLAEQCLDAQGRVDQGSPDDGHVEGAHFELVHRHAQRALVDLQVHVRAPRAKAADDRGKEVVGARGHETDAQLARLARGHPQDARAHPILLDQELPGFRNESPARVRQADAPLAALEQARAEDVFQPLDLLAERGLADVQAVGRAREMQVLARASK